MTLRKLSSTDAFVVTDLDGAPGAGVVRSAPKILQGGARDLARSQTYAFATFNIRRGGASAGINAADADRSAAIAAFAQELATDVAEGTLVFDAAKGVDPALLEPLIASDVRSEARHQQIGGDDLRTHLTGLGPALAADVTAGLEGRTVAIEGFGAHCAALADAITERGAKIVAVSTSRGTRTGDALSAMELRERWIADGENLVGADADKPWALWQAGAEVLFVGSKMGALDHNTAEKLDLTAVIPHQPLPYTARALAVMQRSGTKVVPDFVATAAPLFVDWPAGGEGIADIVATATAALVEAIADTSSHKDGAFLGACYRAESFLSTWQDTVPFGRPLAS